ncbi:hypothetical protein KR032_006476 [Drosophila birchii]|nr:hypothetical protein KR032_006476 [Drosophila birchii]
MTAYMTNIECLNYRQDIFINVSCYVNRTSQGRGRLTVEFSLSKDINEATGNYKVSVKRGSSISEYFSINIDYCKLLRGMQSHYILKMIYSEIRRFSNFLLECPYKMDTHYYLKDFNIDTKVLPSYLPEMDFISELEINYKKNIGLKIFTYGSLVRN